MAKDKRIRLIKHRVNLGLGGARNSGIQAARGIYVAGVDSDDFVLPNMMERLWDASGGQQADVVECGFEQVCEQGSVLARYTPRQQVIDNRQNEVDIFKITKNAFWNKLWRRQLFSDYGIEFPEGVYYEDLATTRRLLAVSKQIRLIPDVLYKYLLRSDSIMGSNSEKHIIDYFKCFDILADFLFSHSLHDRYLLSFYDFIDRNLRHYGESLSKSDLPNNEKESCIRLLIFLKSGFICNHQKLIGIDSNGLLEFLSTN